MFTFRILKGCRALHCAIRSKKISRSFFLSFIILLFGYTQVNAQTAGDYRTVSDGGWTTVGVWETYDGTSWNATPISPTAANGVIDIRNNVTISSSMSLDQVIIETAGFVSIVNGNITLLNGAGSDL